MIAFVAAQSSSLTMRRRQVNKGTLTHAHCYIAVGDCVSVCSPIISRLLSLPLDLHYGQNLLRKKSHIAQLNSFFNLSYFIIYSFVSVLSYNRKYMISSIKSFYHIN